MSSAGVIPRSILKKPPTNTQEERNRQIALQHANLIQQRKDVELEILSAIETLIDCPSPGQSDAALPRSSDLRLVEEALNIFQPSDFDNVTEERNINHRCGYVFCPRPNRRQNTNATFRILQSSSRGRTGLNVVPTRDLEKWCSDECGRRALWLRVQIAEEPAWERRDAKTRKFMLLDSKPDAGVESADASLSAMMHSLEMGADEDTLTEMIDGLALERGDRNLSVRSTRGVEVNVVEHSPRSGKVGSPASIKGPGLIEGYLPKANGNLLRKTSVDDSQDMLETI